MIRGKSFPLLLRYFDFVELYGGSGRISQCIQALVFCCPSFGSGQLSALQFGEPRLVEWVIQL